MKMHCIIHAEFEQPGYFAHWAQQQDIALSYSHCYRGEPLPNDFDYDILLIMGGPQSPKQLDDYPYLAAEIRHIKQAINKNKKVIGVCLGAQLIAESLGATTEKSPHKEIGSFPVNLTADGQQDGIFKHYPQQFLSSHWHSDMPGLPENAKILASSAGCPRQIIKFSPLVYGFQCHLEFNRDCVEALIQHCPDDLTTDDYVQAADAILTQDYDVINKHLNIFLEHLLLDELGNSVATLSASTTFSPQ